MPTELQRGRRTPQHNSLHRAPFIEPDISRIFVCILLFSNASDTNHRIACIPSLGSVDERSDRKPGCRGEQSLCSVRVRLSRQRHAWTCSCCAFTTLYLVNESLASWLSLRCGTCRRDRSLPKQMDPQSLCLLQPRIVSNRRAVVRQPRRIKAAFRTPPWRDRAVLRLVIRRPLQFRHDNDAPHRSCWTLPALP